MTVSESNDICIEIISDGFVVYLNRFLETIESNTDYLVSPTRPICVRSGELSTRSGDKIRVRSVAYDDGNLKLFLGPHLLNYVTMDQTCNQIEFSNLGQLHGQSAMFVAYANKILIVKTEDLIQTIFKTFTHKIVSFILIEKKNMIGWFHSYEIHRSSINQTFWNPTVLSETNKSCALWEFKSLCYPNK